MPRQIITDARLEKYMQTANHDEAYALQLYGWNMQLSEALYPVLSAAEICLRNTIGVHIVDIYGLRWWENDHFCDAIGDRGLDIVRTASSKIARVKRVGSGDMIAQLNLGFWVKLLASEDAKTIWQTFPSMFPHLPKNTSIDQVIENCGVLHELRNRTFHHEPIFTRDLSAEHARILKLISWLSPRKSEWIKQYSRIFEVIRQKPLSPQQIAAKAEKAARAAKAQAEREAKYQAEHDEAVASIAAAQTT